MIKLLFLYLAGFTSRVHGDANNIPKAYESIAFASSILLGFILINNYEVSFLPLLLALTVMSLGKSMANKQILLMLQGKVSRVRGWWSVIRKSIVITAPLWALAFWNEDLERAIILSAGMFHMLVAYELGWLISKISSRVKNNGTVISEILSGVLLAGLAIL